MKNLFCLAALILCCGCRTNDTDPVQRLFTVYDDNNREYNDLREDWRLGGHNKSVFINKDNKGLIFAGNYTVIEQ